MFLLKHTNLCILTLLISACASSSGVIPIGPDTFMISEQGWISTQSTGDLKATAFKKAGSYCVKQNKTVMPVSTKTVPGIIGRSYPEVEIQFMCLTDKDIELQRPKLKPIPDVLIEDNRK